jgi:hypothetical protein
MLLKRKLVTLGQPALFLLPVLVASELYRYPAPLKRLRSRGNLRGASEARGFDTTRRKARRVTQPPLRLVRHPVT